MSFLEAAWDGSVERVSDALRAGVYTDTIMPVSDVGTLDTPLLLHIHITTGRPMHMEFGVFFCCWCESHIT